MSKLLFFGGFIATLCFASLLDFTQGEPLVVKGNVYCDPCRVEFETSLTRPIKEVPVKLQCRSRTNNTISFTGESKTNEAGTYTISVDGDHDDEICEVTLGNSPDPECNDKFKTIDSARVLLTNNVGVVDQYRYPNALGFKQKQTHPDCPKILQEMGYLPEYGFY